MQSMSSIRAKAGETASFIAAAAAAKSGFS
jgi:hypothetical protein